MSWGISSKVFFNPVNRFVLEMGAEDTAYTLGGALYMCGDNTYGQLGAAPGSVPPNTFRQTTIPGKFINYVNCGDVGNIAVITKDNLLYTRGSNQYGQLGYATNAGTTNPNTSLIQVSIAAKTPLWAIFGAKNLVVVTTDGLLYTCGANDYGQLGTFTNLGTTIPNSTLGQVTIAGQAVSYAHYGYNMLAVITTTGALFTCGLNQYGQLGRPQNVGTLSPNPTLTQVSIPDGKLASDVFCGNSFMIVLMTDGTVYTCGLNSFGQLGRPQNSGTSTPNPSLLPISFDPLTPIRSIFAGGNFAAFVTASNSLYTFGSNVNGQLATSVNAGATAPNPTPSLITIPGQTIIAVSCGADFLGVQTALNQLFTCGSNIYGQLGYPTTNVSLNSVLTRVTIPFDGTSIVSDIVQDFNFPTNTTCTAQYIPNNGKYYDPCYFYF